MVIPSPAEFLTPFLACSKHFSTAINHNMKSPLKISKIWALLVCTTNWLARLKAYIVVGLLQTYQRAKVSQARGVGWCGAVLGLRRPPRDGHMSPLHVGRPTQGTANSLMSVIVALHLLMIAHDQPQLGAHKALQTAIGTPPSPGSGPVSLFG